MYDHGLLAVPVCSFLTGEDLTRYEVCLNSLHVEIIHTFSLAVRKLPIISVVGSEGEVDKCASNPWAVPVARIMYIACN